MHAQCASASYAVAAVFVYECELTFLRSFYMLSTLLGHSLACFIQQHKGHFPRADFSRLTNRSAALCRCTTEIEIPSEEATSADVVDNYGAVRFVVALPRKSQS